MNLKLKIKILAVLWVFAATAANATDWESIGSSSIGISYELDTDRVVLYSGPLWRAWVRSDASASIPKQKYEKGMFQYEINCKEATYRTLTMVLYNKSGEPIESLETPLSTHSSVVPESISESIKTNVCAIALSRGFKEWLDKQPKH